ncbi:response regulator [Neobacillus sp. SAB-20_R2A]|uniref:response regulator transcription factor n=1 Tax=Neobacillus sp. SAB-20_R2A TaxID=3120519 RepID=UPI003C6E76A6
MIRLMIVEDQELIRKSLKIVLESISDLKDIVLAENGEAAIAHCERSVPDVILMDIDMPIMDGVQATKVIKDTWPQAKIIILTTFEDIDHVRTALQAGAEGYILKAVDPQFLLRGIELVYYGGSLVPQHLAREVFQSVSESQAAAPEEEKPSASNPYDLNQQELKILSLLSHGFQNKAISEKMFLSLGTVKNYISSIYSKLDVKNRSAAITKAMEECLLPEKRK